MIVNSEVANRTGGRVVRVEAGGLAERLGILPGDRILAVNGATVRDVLDVMYQCADEGAVRIEVERDGRLFSLEGEGDDELGLEFEEMTFDGIRRCRNRCLFCFVDQLPRGLRTSLYVKDDDYRYSVLCGNFVTLTNLTEDDWERLESQRLSPFRVSVHATDNDLRRTLLGNPEAPDVVEQLKRLARLRIAVHCQVVLVPGRNDGAYLERTVGDLAALHPTVESIAIVPVGRTRYADPALSRGFTIPECVALVERARVWQREYRKKYGVGLVYLADELYLRADCPLPSAASYDGFPQYENGIGLVRVLLDDWRRERQRIAKAGKRGGSNRLTAVCGTAIAPLLGEILAELGEVGGPQVHLVPVENSFFGPTVTVSGLLTGADVLDALRGVDPGDLVVLPRAMLDSEGVFTLDGESPGSLEEKLRRPVMFAGTVSEIMRLLPG